MWTENFRLPTSPLLDSFQQEEQERRAKSSCGRAGVSKHDQGLEPLTLLTVDERKATSLGHLFAQDLGSPQVPLKLKRLLVTSSRTQTKTSGQKEVFVDFVE